jgi:hypothetical protein
MARIKPDSPHHFSHHWLILALSALAIALPYLLHALHLPIIYSSYGAKYHLRLFGSFQSLIFLLVGYWETKKHSPKSLEKALTVYLPLLVGFFFLTQIAEYSEKLADYRAYENASNAILAGNNPYAAQDPPYIYPPLPAQALAKAYSIVQLVLNLTGRSLPKESLWELIFYLYQCCQFFAIIIAYNLCRRFACAIGVSDRLSVLLITALFLFNNPMIRNLRFGQMNVYVLDTILFALLLLPHKPFLSGLFLALGGHIKLYPLLFGLPVVLFRKWVVLLGLICGFGFVLFLQTGFAQDWTYWGQFLHYLSKVQTPIRFRNNSLHSLFFNVFRFTGLPENASALFTFLVTLTLLAWFGFRFYQRERAYSQSAKTPHIDSIRQYGTFIDCSALMLMVSPSVWEHHFVLALPMAIWTIARMGPRKPWLVGTGAVLLFVPPTFDIFPLSYHRLVGLLLLIAAYDPKSELGLDSPQVACTTITKITQ